MSRKKRTPIENAGCAGFLWFIILVLVLGVLIAHAQHR